MNKLMKILKLSFLITISLINSTVFCENETIGDSLSSYFQAQQEFSGLDNKINHAAIMEDGFSFQDINTTCTYDSIFYADNYLDLKGGRLFLNKDLILKKTLSFITPAKIYGNNYHIRFPLLQSELSMSTTPQAAYSFLFNNLNLIFKSDVKFYEDASFQDNCSIDGKNNTITFDTTTPIEILQDSSLTIKNAQIYFENYSTIDINSSNASLTLENVLLDIPNGINLANGVISIKGKSDLSGTFSFPITFNANSYNNLFKDTTLHSNWIFTGSTFLNGNGAVLDLNSTGSIIIDYASNLYLSNITLKGLRDGLLIFRDDDSQIYMSNVNIELDEVVTLTIGGIYINGPSTFMLKNYDWTFDQNASLTIDGVTLWKDPLDSTVGGDIKFGTGEQINYLSLLANGTIKTATSSALSLDTADLQNQITNNSNAVVTDQSDFSSLQNESNQNSNAILVNDNDINPIQEDIGQNSNAIITNQTNVSSSQNDISQNSNAILTNENNINSNQTSITQNSNAILTNQSDILSSQSDVSQNSNAIVTNKNNFDSYQNNITQNSNAIITNQNNINTSNNNISTLQTDITENSNAIATNDNDINTLQNNITYNSNAVITNITDLSAEGSEAHITLETHTVFSGAISNTMDSFKWYKNGFTLQDSSVTCTFQSVFPVSSNVNLSGGILYLNADLNFDSPTHIISSGKFLANDHTIELSKTTTVFADGSYSTTINNGNLAINYDLNLAGPLTFQGDCAFNCNGNAITLDSAASILVENNTTLTIKDATICGLSGSNIRCLNDTGKIIFNNVILKPTANCSFSNGYFEILDYLEITGSYTFAYQSSVASTIKSKASLLLENQATFKYNPSSTSKNLITFEDATSSLILDNATLLLTTTGIQLTKGNLYINDVAYLTALGGGQIILGNDSSSDDIYCQISNDSSLNLTIGSLLYKNVNSSAWKMLNLTSILNIYSYTTLSLYQNLDLDDGYANLYKDSILETQANKYLMGAVNWMNDYK